VKRDSQKSLGSGDFLRPGVISMSGQEQSVELRDAPVAPEPGPVAATHTAAQGIAAYISRMKATPLAIVLTMLFVFLPVLVIPYAFSDDYPFLWIADGGRSTTQFGNNVVSAQTINGRPFAGLATEWAFSAAGTIENLRWVRFVGVIGMIALALLLQWALVRSGFKPIAAALIAVFVCTMPPFQVWASWTVLFSTPWAALAAGGASRLAVAAVDGPRRLMTDRLVGAAGLLLAALLTYQPAAMFFWVFFAVALIGAAQERRRAGRLARAHFGIAAVSLAIAYVVIKVSVHVIGSHTTGAARNTLVRDYGVKIDWFLHGPLYQSLNLFKLVSSLWLAYAVALVAIVGLVLLILRRCARPALYLGIGIALIPLSFLPNLVVSENSGGFRIKAALTGLLALYAALGAIGIWITARDWLKPQIGGTKFAAAERLAATAAVTVVGLSIFQAANNVLTLFADPQLTELRLLRSQVRALPPNLSRVAFVQTGYTQGLTKIALESEFGYPTTSQTWNLEASLYLLLHEEGRLPMDAVRPQVDLLTPDTTTVPKGEPVIDLRFMQNLR
jgi:hypothetical protein